MSAAQLLGFQPRSVRKHASPAFEPSFIPSEARPPRSSSGHSLPAARIFSNADGSPYRRVKGRGSYKPAGVFQSVKSAKGLAWEAVHERDAMHLWEADQNVVHFWTQPHKLELHIRGGGVLVYYPDLARQMADGSYEVVETKKTASEARKSSQYFRKLELAQQAYSRWGWKWSLLSADKELCPSIQMSNAKQIVADRHTEITTADYLTMHRLRDALPAGLTYAEVAKALAGNQERHAGFGKAKLHALVARRFIGLDINSAFVDSTPVSILNISR